MNDLPRLAFVAPWFGPDIPGGMEHAAYQTVYHLHRSGLPVEVLTTTIRDFYADWGRNSHKPGRVTLDGIPVHRFPVGRRDKAAFDAVNGLLMQGRPVTRKQEQTFMREMFRVPELYDYIQRHRDEYLFVFIPYLYATTYYGAQIAPERSVIIPCLHDESYAHMRLFQEVMRRVRGLLTYGEAEQELADRLYPPPPGQLRQVVGLGVNTNFTADPDRFRQKYGISGPFLLYAGRKEAGKNLPLLLDYWQRYVHRGGQGQLVLIGSGEMAMPAGMEQRIIDLGFVSAQDKYDAYAAATVFCQPSVNESFSIVIMESWLAGTPVLVHGRCAVTREHVHKANGGLYFENAKEFAATVAYLFENPAVATQLARQGRRYVLENFTWDVVTEKYRALFTALAQERPGVLARP